MHQGLIDIKLLASDALYSATLYVRALKASKETLEVADVDGCLINR